MENKLPYISSISEHTANELVRRDLARSLRLPTEQEIEEGWIAPFLLEDSGIWYGGSKSESITYILSCSSPSLMLRLPSGRSVLTKFNTTLCDAVTAAIARCLTRHSSYPLEDDLNSLVWSEMVKEQSVTDSEFPQASEGEDIRGANVAWILVKSRGGDLKRYRSTVRTDVQGVYQNSAGEEFEFNKIKLCIDWPLTMQGEGLVEQEIAALETAISDVKKDTEKWTAVGKTSGQKLHWLKGKFDRRSD